MIFATVGTQLPFDRLLVALNTWAAQNPDVEIHAQTGDTTASLDDMNTHKFLNNDVFMDLFGRAEIVVAHAGMGTILAASEMGKTVVIMPRLAAEGEHRNDHQVATCERMSVLSNVIVADDETQVPGALDWAIAGEGRASGDGVDPYASPELLKAVSEFVKGEW
jgi:UDP-N-acetylglucosamine transferase subunit ALG13